MPHVTIAALFFMGLALVAIPGWAQAEQSAASVGASFRAAQSRALLLAQRQPETGQSNAYTPPQRGAPGSRVSGATRDLTGKPRVALVIGNGTYQYLPHLTNPASDARLVAATLQSVGFELIRGEAQVDLDRAGFERAIREFGTALANDAVGLFFYAGHGLQLQGVNYLVPVTANPKTAADVDFELINADTVLRQMESPDARLNIIILDACRNNPFGGRGLRDAGGGLAQMQAPRGTLISYATQPGNVAMDGTTDHSPYTAALADAIRKPGIPILEVFNQVGLAVDRATAGRQQPWLAISPLEGAFYFVSPATVNIALPSPNSEIVFWVTIAQSNNSADFEEYLRKFPQGEFAGLAHNRLASLRMPSPSPAAPTSNQKDARVLQTELKRVGCYAGATDGLWGRITSQALQRFNQSAGTNFDVQFATPEAIAAVRNYTSRVCPLGPSATQSRPSANPSVQGYDDVEYYDSTGQRHRISQQNSFTDPTTKERCSEYSNVSFGDDGKGTVTGRGTICVGVEGRPYERR